jgi:phosphoserine aminotransferase
MAKRVFNFYPGPCTFPYEILEQAHAEFLDYRNNGMSLWEISHRTPIWDEVHFGAVNLMREVFRIPDTHDILMLAGGGTLQFAMIPMNLLKPGTFAEYVNTGFWSTKAIADAKLVGDARVIASGEANKFRKIPKDFTVSPDARYLYLTTNNTIVGTEWHKMPETGKVPIVADMSSDILTRPVDWSRVSLAFAGLTKNLGPGGMAVVIIDKKFIAESNTGIPAYLRYDIHSENNSMYNTPPMFSIYLMKLFLEWTRDHGGLDQMDRNSDKKSGMVYQAIDAHPDFYNCLADPADRSRTNICWQMPTKELEDRFVAESEALDMIGLAGFFKFGHCRASLYNAMPMEGVERLVSFMEDFYQRNKDKATRFDV